MLLATSCEKGLDEVATVNETATVSFNIGTPEIATRAEYEYGDGAAATKLQYAVYDIVNGEYVYLDGLTGDTTLTDRKANVKLELATNNTYKVVFWAAAEDAPYSFNPGDENPNISVDYNSEKFKANYENLDAFYASVTVEVRGAESLPVTLTRPFAQLNIGAKDYTEARNANINPISSKIVVNAYTAMNLITGEVDVNTQTVVTFKENAIDTNVTFPVGIDTYKYLAMAYLLVGEQKETVDVTFSYTTETDKTFDRTVGSVPVERNSRTNIYGKLLTSSMDINVDINEGFNNDKFYQVLKDLDADNTLVLSGKGTLVLDNINISTESGSAIKLAEGAEITIEIVNGVTLKGATNGILVPAGASLTVTGKGNLVVEGKNGSGIGAKGVEAGAGNIKISGLAHITAKGNGDHAFGIGGNNSNVVIFNSTVDYACGGYVQPDFKNDLKYGKSEPEGGATIGGATIKIEESTITEVDGGSKAAAIGAQYWQSTSIEIINSTIKEANGGNASAGIGGSRYGNDSKYDVSIKIQNSTVTATGGQGGAGIGSGYDTHCNGQNYSATNYIEIDGESTINAKGGKYAAGIGTGFHSAYLSGSIADGATITAESGDENFYKDSYTTAQNIGYGVVDPAREFSGNNANVTFTVNGEVIEHPHPVVTIGGVAYGTFEAAIAAAKAGDVVTLVSDVTLASELTLPAGITLNGNGHQINGTIVADGDLTFAGHTKVTSFSASYYDRTITIGEGACLEVTGDGRVSLAYGNTFNVTGSITDAKNADKTTIQPSLIIPGGISITGGNDASLNITNAYVKIGSTTSKNSVANGTFNIKITNSIAEFTDQLTFAEPTNGKNPTFNINVTNSVLTTAKKLCIAAPNTNMVVDNSTVTLGTNFRNSGKVELKKGSVLTGKTIQFGENGGNNGQITVDDSSLTITAGSTGHAFDGQGKGSITLKNSAVVDVDYFKDMTINADVSSTFTTLTTMPSVAKVGNTEYPFIDQAIANWTHNTTLTLLDNVTLNDVVTLKSTEYHVLDLGTYTLTAAKSKDAISITAEGRTSASYALDIKADATNPGGITATSKAVVKTTGKSGVKDRPIIRFYNGVFNANNVISHSGSNGTNCPQFQFHGGVYNCSLSANRALIQIYGGTFNGRFNISVDSSAYALISGGKFKYLDNLYGSALNTDKFTIGSSKGNFDRGVYVDDEGYIVVGGPVITEFGDKFTAKATNASKAGSYLPYSSAATYGLYYTNAAAAIAKHGEANVVLK